MLTLIKIEQSNYNKAKELRERNVRIKLLINAFGYLHDSNYLPEKQISDLKSTYLLKSFKINSIGNALVIKYFGPLMDHANKSTIVCLSARIGSINDNYLGGWFGYRASKAALNQIIKTASIEYSRKKSKLILVSMHPGTVITKLSKPFINKANYFTPSQAANNILRVNSRLKDIDTGTFIDYEGKKISY